MKIYLAGKMDEAGAWRDVVLQNRYDEIAKRSVSGWHLFRDVKRDGYDAERISMPWPRQANTLVLGLHEYVGPYRTDVAENQYVSKWMGDFHGSTVRGGHGQTNGEEDGLIVAECQAAVSRCDLFFAYINSPDCFGTLVEVGLAKAAGAFVVLAVEAGAEWDWADYWFTERMADATVRVPDPIKVGPEPECEGPSRWEGPALDARIAWEARRDAERERIRGLIVEAILLWTARTQKPAPVALIQRDETEPYIRALQEAAGSLTQIARWTADPRVRNEAQRMLKRIAG